MKNLEIQEEFNFTEIGLLPKDWKVKKVIDVFEFTTKPRNLEINKYEFIPFLPMSLISENNIYPDGYNMKKPSDIGSGKFFQKNDLLIAKITPSFENGKQCIVKDLPIDFGYATTEVWVMHPRNNQVDSYFLFFYLKKQDIRFQIAGKMEGSTGRQRIPKNILEDLLIPLPPIDEQREIANNLSIIQFARQKTEEIIISLKELRKSLLKHLITYGYTGSLELDTIQLKETEIGHVLESWEESKINNKCDVITGGTPDTKVKEYWEPKDVPWMKSGEIQGNKITAINTFISQQGLEKSNARWLPKESVVIALAGRGKTRATTAPLEIECACNQSVICLKPNHEINYMYLHYYLTYLYSYIRHLTGDKDRSGLNKQIVGNIPLFYPNMKEQHQIALILSLLDEKIENKENNKKAHENLFKSLLYNLMAGKIRVYNRG